MKESRTILEKLSLSYEEAGAPKALLAGLSGGADSVFLVRALLDLQGEKGFSLSCVHVNHHLRPDADEDERFVRQLCQSWEVELIVKSVSVSKRGNLEANARSARYSAFQEAMGECGAQVLALAHHMDDQAETMLMRLMRGSGASGMAAMRSYSAAVWRPLLGVRRAEIEAQLKQQGIGWCEDESNRDERFTRNAIRHRVLPLLEDISPSCVPNMAATSRLLGDEEAYWVQLTAGWLEQNASLHPSCLFIKLQDFDTLHVAARRRVLRSFCQQAGVSLERAQAERLLWLCGTSSIGSDNLSGGFTAYKTASRLHLVDAKGAALSLGHLQEELEPDAGNRRVEVFDADLLKGAELRYRRPGDRIKPLGMVGTQSLSDYLINRRMDRPFRDQWPVLAKGQDILWVIGHGMAQSAAVRQETVNRRVLAYVGRLPDETQNDLKEIEE